MSDWGSALREIIGCLALFSGTAQLVIRFMLYHHADNWPVKRRERAISVSIFILMAGIAYGQLLHLTAPITIASWMIFIGVIGTVYAVYIVWRDERMLPETKAIVELEDFEVHRHRPTRAGRLAGWERLTFDGEGRLV